MQARMVLDDTWEWIVASVANENPSEIDYVNQHWTHTQIARHYLMKHARKG